MTSSSASSSSSRSSSPESVPKRSKKSNAKDKGKKKNTAQIADRGKNEGVDPTWAYKAPVDFGELINSTDAGDFDWDAVDNDDDVELWLIRVPESVKPKYLENTSIELAAPSKSARIGTLGRKHATFDIWSVGDDNDENIGGEEIKELSCLLPRKSKNGKFYPASKPFARHIVVSAQAVKPSFDPSSESSPGPIVRHKNPPRQCYPKEVLKHKFMPYGSVSGLEPSPVAEKEGQSMDVDVPDVPVAVPPSPTKATKVDPTSSPKETKKLKGKKRKGESEAPAAKKSKRAKTS